jgi:hypothetical protein
MRITLILLIASALLAGCEDSNAPAKPTAKSTDSAAAIKNPAANPKGATPQTLVRNVHALEKTDEQCDADGCPKVDLQWLTFENQAELNDSITQHLAAMLIHNEDNPSHDVRIEDLADAFLQDASDMAMASRQGWELTATVKKQGRRGDVITLSMETYEYTGGAHGLPSVQYFHWDLAKQQSVKLNDMLVPGQQAAFWEKAREQHTAWLNKENLDQAFRDSWPFDKTDNVFFTDKGLVLQYNVYHIAPYAMGQPTLTIPYSDLDGILRAPYL